MPAEVPAQQSFGAFSVRGYRAHFATYMLAMMADNIEHVISYWVAFQKFHSPALGGFAVVSHWLPFLLFSVGVGGLNDRFDSRRIIQAAMALFICASVGWGIMFATDSLTEPGAMALLVLHGCAGVLWGTSSQMLIYDIVGPAHLPSAVRLNATARYLGVLVGPAVGGGILLALGPTYGIFVNTLFYLPLVIWLIAAPYGRHFRGAMAGPKRAVRGIADILQTIRDIAPMPVLGAMIVLAGGASFFVGNSYQAQMPSFASDFGHGNQGVAYSVLLAADAAGALIAGVVLEIRGRGLLSTTPRSAMILAMGWAAALGGFALVGRYEIALVLLFAAGFFELSFSSMTATIVQLNAPNEIRGRVLGLFNMSAMGLRAFSGVCVGLLGSAIGVHISLAIAAGAFFVVAAILRAAASKSDLPPP